VDFAWPSRENLKSARPMGKREAGVRRIEHTKKDSAKEGWGEKGNIGAGRKKRWGELSSATGYRAGGMTSQTESGSNTRDKETDIREV